MSFSTGFHALMPDGVSVKTLLSVSTDGYGEEVFSTSPTTYKARVVRKQTLVRTFAGTEELANTTVYIASTTTFSPYAEITVNGEVPGPLMALEAYPDRDGIHHLKASFGN